MRSYGVLRLPYGYAQVKPRQTKNYELCHMPQEGQGNGIYSHVQSSHENPLEPDGYANPGINFSLF